MTGEQIQTNCAQSEFIKKRLLIVIVMSQIHKCLRHVWLSLVCMSASMSVWIL